MKPWSGKNAIQISIVIKNKNIRSPHEMACRIWATTVQIPKSLHEIGSWFSKRQFLERRILLPETQDMVSLTFYKMNSTSQYEVYGGEL